MKDETGEAVRQWRTKARSDWTTVEILLASDQYPADAVCFHCQQFVEKLLKALLTRHGIEAPKTHDVRRLIQLAEPLAPELSRFSDASDALTAHGVETRYPGDWHEIEPTEMNEIVELAKQLGEMLQEELDR
ncbi:MAG: HEPN domain-containing protein [Planctomycetota bacterium]|jgi:HEPN domain-containing protein